MSSRHSELATVHRVAIVQDCFNIAAATILLYDATITFGQELELLWKRKRSAVAFLFMSNRVLSILYAASLIPIIIHWTQLLGCMASLLYFMIPELLLFLVWAVFSAVRVYAIGDRAWRTATIVFLLASAPFAANLRLDATYRFTSMRRAALLGHCVVTAELPSESSNLVEIITRVSAIASDAIVLLVTWRHTHDVRKHVSTINMKPSLSTLLLRDGTLFFAAGLILNVGQLIVFLKFSVDGIHEVNISHLVTTFSCIITSRFLLSLRQFSKQGPASQTTSGSVSWTPPVAQGVLSPMSAELELDFGVYSDSYLEDTIEMETLEQDVPRSRAEAQPSITEEVSV